MMKNLLKEWKSFLKEDRTRTDQLKSEIQPRIREYAQVVLDSIINKQFYIFSLSDGGIRPVVILDTQHGPIAYYNSSGKSTPGQKEEGEWTIFGGYRASKTLNIGFLEKNRTSLELTQGGDRYLTTLSLVLEHLWITNQIQNNCERVALYKMAQRNIDNINQKIDHMNQQEERYIHYESDELQGAYLNSFLDEAGVFDNSFLSRFFSGIIVGVDEVKSEHLTQVRVFDKVLPKLEDII